MRQSCSSAYCGEGAFIWTTQSIKIIPVSPFLFKHPIGWNNGRSRCNKIFESCVNFFNSARHWSGWNFRPHGRMASRIQIQNGHLLEASNYFRIRISHCRNSIIGTGSTWPCIYNDGKNPLRKTVFRVNLWYWRAGKAKVSLFQIFKYNREICFQQNQQRIGFFLLFSTPITYYHHISTLVLVLHVLDKVPWIFLLARERRTDGVEASAPNETKRNQTWVALLRKTTSHQKRKAQTTTQRAVRRYVTTGGPRILSNSPIAQRTNELLHPRTVQ